jgi:hypothetical protein
MAAMMPLFVKLQFGIQQQGEGRFEGREGKGAEKVNADEESNLLHGQHMADLLETGTANGWRSILFSRFGQDDAAEDEVDGANHRSHDAGTGETEVFEGLRSEDRAQDETQAEGHADEPHAFGSLFRSGDVGDEGRSHG